MKNKFTLTLLLILVTTLSNIASAGIFPSKEQIEEFKKDKLYVILQSNAEDLFDYYEENNIDLTEEQTLAIELGMGPIDEINTILRDVVSTEWNQSADIEFISTLTFSKMFSDEKLEFSYLSIYFDSKELMNSYKEDEKKDLVFPTMSIARKKKKKGFTISAKMRTGVPSKGDLTFAIQEIQVAMGYSLSELSNSERRDSAAKKNANELKSRTLLICEDDISKKLTEGDIKANYPYKFQIVDRETYDLALEEKDETKLNLMVLPLSASTGAVVPGLNISSIKYFQVIAMPENGEFATIVYKLISPPGMPTGLQEVRKHHFTNYLKHVSK